MTEKAPSNDNDDLRLVCADLFKFFVDKKLTDAQGMTVMTLCTAYLCQSDQTWEHFKQQVAFARMGIHNQVAGHA